LEYLINYGILNNKDIMNELLEVSDDKVKDTMLSIIRESFRDLPMIETDGKSRHVRVRYTGAGGKAVGLARLNFTRDKDGNISVSYGEDTFLSKPLLQKIQMAANMIIKHSSKPNIEFAFPTVEAFKEDVNKSPFLSDGIMDPDPAGRETSYKDNRISIRSSESCGRTALSLHNRCLHQRNRGPVRER
jgi:hypothetical protein